MTSKIEEPPWTYYTGDNLAKMSTSTHYENVQTKLTERALEILDLDNMSYQVILDIGCGSSFSGQVLNSAGHVFVGLDIAPQLLLAGLDYQNKEIPNSFVRCDVGEAVPFRAGVFDAAIGIDVIRWLFVQFEGQEPVSKRLRKFFETLHGSLKPGGKVALNFHPETSDQSELLIQIATRCGFGGGILTDFPNSPTARVHWLQLELGGGTDQVVIDKAQPGCLNVDAQRTMKRHGKKVFNKKEWITKKKERQRLLGKKVANDSKYTARSRRRWN